MNKKGMVQQLLPALVVPLFLIIMVAVYTQFGTNVDQSGWSTDANTTYTRINTGTWNGYRLASLLPYVIIAVIVLGVLIGAFVFRA